MKATLSIRQFWSFGAILLCLCLSLLASVSFAQETPAPPTSFQAEFDKLASEKDLSAAARHLVYTAAYNSFLMVKPVVLPAEATDDYATTRNFLYGVASFARASRDGFKPLFEPGGTAKAATISLSEAKKLYEDALERIDTNQKLDRKFMDGFPLEKTQIIQFTINKPPDKPFVGDVQLLLFFTKVTVEKRDVWRLSYGIGLVSS